MVAPPLRGAEWLWKGIGDQIIVPRLLLWVGVMVQEATNLEDKPLALSEQRHARLLPLLSSLGSSPFFLCTFY